MVGRETQAVSPKRKTLEAKPALRPSGILSARDVSMGEAGDLVSGRGGKVEKSREVGDVRRELLERWAMGGPRAWLWGVDPTSPDKDFPAGRPLIWTKDESKPGVAAFNPWPAERDRPYLVKMAEDIYGSEEPLILIDKPRQIMATWLTTLLVDYECRFTTFRKWILSKTKEAEAIAILDDKPRFVHSRLPQWLQEAMPVKMRPKVQNEYLATESLFKAVTENVADSEARGITASGVLIDEAAFQRRFKEIVAACMPMAVKIVAISTANIGNPGAQYFYQLVSEGLDEKLL